MTCNLVRKSLTSSLKLVSSFKYATRVQHEPRAADLIECHLLLFSHEAHLYIRRRIEVTSPIDSMATVSYTFEKRK
jgi:hypothetical protein